LKTAPISASVLEDFVTCYHAEDRSKPGAAEGFRAFGYDELVARDKADLGIFWLEDESLEGAENPQPPDVIAAEIAENLEAALEQFAQIHEDLSHPTPSQLGPDGPLQANPGKSLRSDIIQPD
jgi:type I restriction enzyme M protein